MPQFWNYFPNALQRGAWNNSGESFGGQGLYYRASEAIVELSWLRDALMIVRRFVNLFLSLPFLTKMNCQTSSTHNSSPFLQIIVNNRTTWFFKQNLSYPPTWGGYCISLVITVVTALTLIPIKWFGRSSVRGGALQRD